MVPFWFDGPLRESLKSRVYSPYFLRLGEAHLDIGGKFAIKDSPLYTLFVANRLMI